MATLPAAYPVQLTTLYLGQVQRLNLIGTMMFVPGTPVVVMPFTKLNVTSQSQATTSPGAAISPSSSTRTFVGSVVAVTHTMAPTLGCSTRATAMATASTIADSALLFLLRAHSIPEYLYRSKVNLLIGTTMPVYLLVTMVVKCLICITHILLQFIIYYDHI